MNLPKTLKIGAHNFTIKYPYVFTEHSDCLGQCNVFTEEIKIASKDFNGEPLPDDVILVSFIHEVLYAIDMISGYHVFDSDEPGIEGFSELMCQVIKDNNLLKQESVSAQIETRTWPDDEVVIYGSHGITD